MPMQLIRSLWSLPIAEQNINPQPELSSTRSQQRRSCRKKSDHNIVPLFSFNYTENIAPASSTSSPRCLVLGLWFSASNCLADLWPSFRPCSVRKFPCNQRSHLWWDSHCPWKGIKTGPATGGGRRMDWGLTDWWIIASSLLAGMFWWCVSGWLCREDGVVKPSQWKSRFVLLLLQLFVFLNYE